MTNNESDPPDFDFGAVDDLHRRARALDATITREAVAAYLAEMREAVGQLRFLQVDQSAGEDAIGPRWIDHAS